MRLLVVAALCTTLCACGEGNVPGIGGSAFDPPTLVAEVNAYPGYVSPAVIETVDRSCPGKATQQFEKMFDDFRLNYSAIGRLPVELAYGGLRATFSEQLFVVTDGNGELIHEQLPRAFYMDDMWLGIDQVGGADVIMVSTRTRSTTGRYFVGMYAPDGTAYFRRVLSAGDVWDIHRSESGIEILGACSTRKITFVAQNKSVEHTHEE